ncbi:MAG: hypothetical protein K2Z80_13920 [Xanthobacteraceae bacterium]|nr:hypothetical protein [Xanthobacteraceae bacterium]
MNWGKVGGIAGAVLFVVLLTIVAIGPGSSCSSREFPFLCLVAHVFGQ